MKKHRKVGNSTSTNFYTSQFQLKSSQLPRQSRQKKINTTFSNFRHQLFHEQPKPQQRYRSKDSKPIIQQLKFLTSKQDDFKIPLSVTKRSLSKAKEESRLKLESKNKQLYDEHFQQIPVNKDDREKKIGFYQFAAAKRIKQSTTRNPLKEKLQRTALQKYNQAVSKENEENQNVVSQKNAESLYLLLKNARNNQLKNQNFNTNSLASEIQGGQTQQIPRNDNVFDERKIINPRKSSFQGQSQNESSNNKNVRNVIKSKQNLFKQIDEKTNPSPIKTIQHDKKPDIPKPKVVLPVSQPSSAQTEVIKFKKVQCDPIRKETFTSSQLEQSSDFGQTLQQQSKISYNRNKPIEKKNSQENIPKPQHTTQKQHIVRKQSIKITQNSQKNIQSDDEKKPIKNNIKSQPKKPEIKQKKNEQSDLDNIPSGQTFDKPATGKQIKNEKPERKSSNHYLQLNNNKIQKVLTPKHLDQPTIKTAPKINPPPKLPSTTENRKPIQSHPVQDDQLEEIQIGNQKKNKKQIQAPKQVPQKLHAKQEEAKKQKTTVVQNKKVETSNQETQKQQEQHDGQESQTAEIEDELTYYIERIEDIGQYRINSKDAYNDKSIDKELVQIHKICAYYMAHQFFYLAQWTCNYFKSNNYINDYYSLTTDDLKQLKQSGVLDAQVENLTELIESSKKLIKKCYEQCKPFLKKQQQILIIDGKTNYHIRCCATLIKQFKKIYDLFQKSPKNAMLMQRCVYLIEMYCVLKLLNGQQLKQYEDFQDIQNPAQHIETYKKHLLSL